MQQRGLLLVPRRASGGVGSRLWGMTRGAVDRRCLGDASGASSPALGTSPTSVSHGHDGRSHTSNGRKIPAHPLPGAPNVGFRVPADPLGSNTGVRTEISPSTYLYLAASLGSKQSKEQHKRHRVYTSSGHHCGVIPYSSLWCGGLPLGLMMNSTREEQPREGCSCGGVVPLEGSIPDASVASPIDRVRGPGPLPKY